MRVIIFHGLGEPPVGATSFEAQYWVDPTQFRRIMDRIVEFDDYEITFDDGNRSDIEIAVPILQRRKLTASFFPLAGRLGKPGSLTATDLRAMISAGMKIGSHGVAHKAWTDLGASDLDEELGRSREELSKACGCEVTAAACPFGRYNSSVLKALYRHGYKRIYTSDGGQTSPNARLLSRSVVLRQDGPEVLDRLLRPDHLTATRQQARSWYRRMQAFAR